MVMSIEKRLAALEIQHLSAARNLTVRLVEGRPTAEQEAEHAALRASGVLLLVIELVTPDDVAASRVVEPC